MEGGEPVSCIFEKSLLVSKVDREGTPENSSISDSECEEKDWLKLGENLNFWLGFGNESGAAVFNSFEIFAKLFVHFWGLFVNFGFIKVDLWGEILQFLFIFGIITIFFY